MANPNPNPATRFGASGGTGNPSRAKQKGARDRLSAAFLGALSNDFETNGKSVIETVRAKDPSTYLRVVASLLPQELDIRREDDDADPERIERAIEILNAIIDARTPKDITESVEVVNGTAADAVALAPGSQRVNWTPWPRRYRKGS